MARLHPHQGRRRDRGDAAARDHQGVRGADPRHRRAGHGRDGQGPPRRLPGGRRRGALRACRRATTGSCAARPGVQVDAVATDGKRRTLFTTKPVAGTPLRLTLQPRLQLLAERILADVGPASAIVAVRPSTGAVVAAANGPGTTATTTRPTAASPLARRSRPWARWRCSGTARRRRHRWSARPASTSTARCSPTTASTRRRPTAGSRWPPRWPTPATPPTSTSAASSARTTSSTPPPRSGWGSTTTWASRRTSATSCRPPPRRPRPPT